MTGHARQADIPILKFHFFLCPERVALMVNSVNNVRFGLDLRMTGVTQTVDFLDEQRFPFCGMREMTGKAHASRDRRVNVLIFKSSLIVAIKAHLGHSTKKKLLLFGLVRLMAAGAHAGGYGSMNDLPCKTLLVMTGIAQVRHGLKKQFFLGRCMRPVAGCTHTSQHRRVYRLLAGKTVLVMTAEAKIGRW